MISYFEDPDFGYVEVHLRRGMRRITVKRKNDYLLVTAPRGMDGKDIVKAFNQMKPQIASLKMQQVQYYIGQVIKCFGCEVTIESDPQLKDRICYGKSSDKEYYIRVPHDIDFKSFSTQKIISDALKSLMKNAAPTFLIPYARQLATTLNVPCGKITIGYGMRKLGHCTIKNDIMLSANIMFLPKTLIAYVICHELAHVTHHDHSPAFHALVNQYVGDNEKILEKLLRQFQWPILR